MSSKLTRAMSVLIASQDRAFAEIFLQLKWVTDTTMEYPMGIRIMDGSLVFNPHILEQCSDTHVSQLLMHEGLHLILDHIPRMAAVNGLTEKGNIAADLTVNQFVPGFPDSVVIDGETRHYATINNFKKTLPGIQSGQTFEYYFKLLQEVGEDEMPQTVAADSHDGMEEDGESRGAKARKARSIVQKAVDRAVQAGQEPAGRLRELISELLSTKTDWKRVLRNFPQDAEVVSYVAHRFRRNRKYGYAFPGYKPERAVKIAVAIDLSGSITDEVKETFCHELDTIHKNGCEIEVIFFNDTVTGQETYTPALLKKEWGGGGGTCFQPVIDAAAELNVDGLIFLTDGMNFDTVQKPTFPVLWGILEGFQFDQPFGRHVILEGEKR